MAFGSSSAIFREFIAGPCFQASGTGWTGLDSDTIMVANYGNSGTPDKDAAVGLTGYNAATSAWVTANQVTDTNWPAVGLALASKTVTTPSTGVIMFDAADRAGSGSVTLANVYGCLIYDDSITAGTVADQGVCFLAYGGAQSVTAGTFTIVWSANGILRITV